MSERGEDSGGLDWGEIIFTLFRHKRKIIACALIGLVAAALVHFLMPPYYTSKAKLYIPYVVDRSTVDSAEEATATSRANDAIINSEIEILTSWDLVMETVSTMPPRTDSRPSNKRVGPVESAREIADRIKVTVEKGMNVITVTYKDPDPEYATRFLRELVKNYREKHLVIHRSPYALDVITQRRDEVRKQLEQTESELKQLRSTVQSLSVADSTVSLTAAITKAEEELNAAEANRRGQEARVEAVEKMTPGAAVSTGAAAASAAATPSDQETERHRFIVQLLSELRERERSLLAMYPPESRMVKIPRKQISELEAQRRALEGRYPTLALMDPVNGNSQAQTIISERAKLAAMKATEVVLRAQLAILQERREQFAELAPRIARLELEKQVQEANYKNIEGNLAKAQDDRVVDWSKISNIASVQEPTPASLETDPLKKKVTMSLVASGLVMGLGIAFLRESTLQRKLKRPSELEGRLSIPLLLSIPFIRDTRRRHPTRQLKGKKVPALPSGREDADRARWETDQFIRPFCEAIRDHILLSFEIRNLDHKPKLIGITGFSSGAGTTTLAAGVAAALAEIGDGKVLLVDMNVENGEEHPFFHRTAALPLSSILESDTPPPSAAENLYIATGDISNTKRTRMGLRRFNNLVPSLRAADFDYIIFDMPTLDTTSPTLGMAGFLDKIVLVIEAERTDRDTVKRFYSDLTDAGANVSCVFNKVRSYGPKWLEGVE